MEFQNVKVNIKMTCKALRNQVNSIKKYKSQKDKI